MYKIILETQLQELLDYSPELEQENPALFNRMLWDMGLDSEKGIEKQEGLQHRGANKEIITCNRYVGLERTDAEWLGSGLASEETLYLQSDSETRKDMRRLQFSSSNTAPYHKLEEEYYKVKYEALDDVKREIEGVK